MLVVLVQAIIEYISADKGVYKHILTDYSSLFRLTQGYLIFILVYNIKINNDKVKNIFADISKLTLDIYLASFITDRLIYKAFKVIYNIHYICLHFQI